MRTINTSYDFTILAPDAYTFVFAPNIMTVTLGSSHAINATVTISGNGVTLSRKAINRVVLFDLSAIFRSKFPSTDFTLTYSNASTDPLYAASFNVGVAVGTDTENVPFTLRWGAIQLDSTFTTAYNNLITFPFWSGYPLILNAEISHTFLNAVGYTITASAGQFLNIPTNQDADFTMFVGTGSTETQTTYFKARTCPSDGVYLRWIDNLGRVRHYMFYKSKNQGIRTEITQTQGVLRYPTDYTDSAKGRRLVLNKPKQRSVNLFTSCETDIFHIVASIAASPFVHWYTASRWVRVNIQPATLAPSTGWMSDIEITMELPTDYVQEL